MQDWFLHARFGIFLHWGIYSAGGIEASWPFRYFGTPNANAQSLPYEQYMKLAPRFTASHYDPTAWAKLFRSLGAWYVVLTAKHHDGVALWPTKAGGLSVAGICPQAPADLIGPFCEAMRTEGLKIGLYYSHADWSHPAYENVARWEEFRRFHWAQMMELCEFRPDLLWFDAAWEKTEAQWRMAELAAAIRARLPQVIMNDRMSPKSLGDYATPEQVLPLAAPAGPWEYCATLNHQWGYSPDNTQLKPAHRLTRMLAGAAGLGGNLLLNIGPREDGTFDPPQQARLEELGAWVRAHAAAIFGTLPGLPATHFAGPSTLTADHKTLYLFIFEQSPALEVPVHGLRNAIRRAHRLDTGAELSWSRDPGAPWHNVPGTLWLDLNGPIEVKGTAVALELEGALDLWGGI